MVFEPKARKNEDEPLLEQHEDEEVDKERLLAAIPHVTTQRMKQAEKHSRKDVNRSVGMNCGTNVGTNMSRAHAEQCNGEVPFDVYTHTFLVHIDRSMFASDRFEMVQVEDSEMQACIFDDEVVCLGDVKGVFVCKEW